MAARVFVSYSHRDEELRDQLEVQLAMLKRQGLVDVWHDRRLHAGDHLDGSIGKELDEADIILLLVSPDFLASDYCYNIEKAGALERHKDGEARLISVILRPCEWQHTELADYLVTPTDGKPITRWADRDEAFLDVTRQIRRAIEELGAGQRGGVEKAPVAADGQVDTATLPRSSNLRLRKTFTEADADRFLADGFDFIDRFFRGSLDELATRNPDIETRHRNIDAKHFTSAIYRQGKKVGACTIRLGGMFGGITYADGDNAGANTCNESLSVEHDDQKLFFRPMGMPHSGLDRGDGVLSHEGAAEYLWALLIHPLQGA
jgi:TIR domain